MKTYELALPVTDPAEIAVLMAGRHLPHYDGAIDEAAERKCQTEGARVVKWRQEVSPYEGDNDRFRGAWVVRRYLDCEPING